MTASTVLTLQDRLQHLEWIVGNKQLESNLISHIDDIQSKLAQVAVDNVQIDHFLSLYLLSDLESPPTDQEFKKQMLLSAEQDLMDHLEQAAELETIKEVIDLPLGDLDTTALNLAQGKLQKCQQKVDLAQSKFADLVSEYQQTVATVSKMFSLFNSVLSEMETRIAKLEKSKN